MTLQQLLTTGKSLVAQKKKSSVKRDQNDIAKLLVHNKVLATALKQIQSCAEEHSKHNFELVWFALNRTRYPNHPASKNIKKSESHREDLDKLRSNECDFHHGFNSGVLATSRLFKQISDVSFVLNDEDDGNKLVQKHEEKVQRLKSKFPDISVDSFPSQI
jgi:hypothetical protein